MDSQPAQLTINHDGATTDDRSQRNRGIGLPRKSPSTPEVRGSFDNMRRIDAVPLPKHELTRNVSSTLDGSSVDNAEASLSVIDIYGDEVESRRTNDLEAQESNGVSNGGSGTSLAVFSRSRSNGTEEQSFDRYGFKKQSNFISEKEYNEWWQDYSQYCVRRKHKWKLFMEKSGLPLDNDSPYRFPSRSEKLRRYVRKGIPAEWRGNAWWHFARGQEKLNKNRGLYDRLLSQMNEKGKKKAITDLDVIERDLHRTFPDNIHFQREKFQDDEPTMIRALRRVLVAFSWYNPKIGYCQSMNFLAGLLLLFLDEERAFWMLVIITSRYLPGVHNVNLEGVNIDQGVLMLCVKEYLPEFWRFIVPFPNQPGSLSYSQNPSLGKNEFLYKLPPITLCTASWFMGCFVGVLPIESTLRVWDCLFYEESHFLFKTSLAIMKLSEQELSKGKPLRALRQYSMSNGNENSREIQSSQDEAEMEIFQIVQTFPKRLLNPNDIFDKIIFKKRIPLNKLDQNEIDRCRKYVAAQRQKYKNFHEIMGNDRTNSGNSLSGTADLANNRNFEMNVEDNGLRIRSSDLDSDKTASELINSALSSEVYGFKRGLSGVHWNNSIKEKVRQMRKKKVISDEQLKSSN
ncbi:hypothetical protein HG536_0E02160 [Torulaspora globosa]|uniref:Rab-GAP TBC domain-containing protein n=1 Tax=Torulaspora globosa TaxID=48254 RepID=A0A7G3ZIG9_9SACH|nr:uncharacterized protein HG536_0E02160 [Torulaspora globosa]QLL33305.1 hypothetical protein HG536_0E02160 [Torulaspora globosa]